MVVFSMTSLYPTYINICLSLFINHLLFSLSRVTSGSSWSKMVKEEPVIDYFDVQD